jgi:hypothetical protein
VPVLNDVQWLSEPPLEAEANLLGLVRGKIERSKIFTFYPERGPLRQEPYPKHQAFLAAGKRRWNMSQFGQKLLVSAPVQTARNRSSALGFRRYRDRRSPTAWCILNGFHSTWLTHHMCP